MALIKCPECGKDISENAISCPNCGEPIRGKRLTGEIDSGTETFSITEKNRLSLSASANAEINTRTARLSQQGKNVINVQKSEPHPITIGVTVWTMDITIIWNASLDNPIYKEYLYNHAKTLLQNGNQNGAVPILRKIATYRDSQDLLSRSEVVINEQTQQINAVGKDPRKARGLLWFTGICVGILGLLAYLLEGNMTPYYGAPVTTGCFVIAIIIVVIGEIIINIRAASYDRRLEEYNEQK